MRTSFPLSFVHLAFFVVDAQVNLLVLHRSLEKAFAATNACSKSFTLVQLSYLAVAASGESDGVGERGTRVNKNVLAMTPWIFIFP